MAEIERQLNDLTSQLKTYHVEEKGLSFCGKQLKLNDENDAQEVAVQIENCPHLTFLNLDGNTIGVNAAKRIGQSLRTHPEFKQAIWKNMFTGRTKEEIPDALRYLGGGLITAKAQLVELDLSDNAFGPIGVEGLEGLFHSTICHTLEILRLNNNGLGITGGKLLAKLLQECYEKSNKKFGLRVYQAGRNRLENPGAIALGKVFKMFGTLVEVSMPQNGIYYKGVTALSEAFKNNPHLKIINLNDNTVREKGAAALAAALPNLQNLETLNLGDCLLKTKGAIILAKALTAKHSNLQTVSLDHGEINAKGGVEIAKALKNKPSLISLNLDGNQFGDDGIKQIRDILKSGGRDEALTPFEEDEGCNSEEEEEEEVSSDENESTEHESENESEQDEPSHNESSLSVSRTTVPEFLSSSSINNFLALGPDKEKLFVDYIETSESEEFVKNAMIVLLAVSNLSDVKQEIAKKEVTSCTVHLYKYLFDWADKNDKVSLVTNAILVQLRLIKAEEKRSLIECNQNSCILALQEAMAQNGTIPQSCKDMFKVFLQKRKSY